MPVGDTLNLVVVATSGGNGLTLIRVEMMKPSGA
jgi:hypothetical protein